MEHGDSFILCFSLYNILYMIIWIKIKSKVCMMTSSIFMLIHSHYTLYDDSGYLLWICGVLWNTYINTLFHFHVCKMQSYDIYKGPQEIEQTIWCRKCPRKIFDPKLAVIQIVISAWMQFFFVFLNIWTLPHFEGFVPCSGVPKNFFFLGGGATNSVDKEQTERESGGSSP
jgi:hypothetical protein